MEDFLQASLLYDPSCRIFSQRQTREIVLSYDNVFFVLKNDTHGQPYWAVDWNDNGYI